MISNITLMISKKRSAAEFQDLERITNRPKDSYLMPSTVSEVSAMLVLTMHFRVPPSASSKIFACKSAGNCEYMGKSNKGGTPSPSWPHLWVEIFQKHKISTKVTYRTTGHSQ